MLSSKHASGLERPWNCLNLAIRERAALRVNYFTKRTLTKRASAHSLYSQQPWQQLLEHKTIFKKCNS